MNDIRRKTSVWMALAFSASLGLAISIIAAFGMTQGSPLRCARRPDWLF